MNIKILTILLIGSILSGFAINSADYNKALLGILAFGFVFVAGIMVGKDIEEKYPTPPSEELK